MREEQTERGGGGKDRDGYGCFYLLIRCSVWSLDPATEDDPLHRVWCLESVCVHFKHKPVCLVLRRDGIKNKDFVGHRHGTVLLLSSSLKNSEVVEGNYLWVLEN